MWSINGILFIIPIFIKEFVISLSSSEGFTSFEGWLCIHIIVLAEFKYAYLNISLGCTTLLLTVPLKSSFLSIICCLLSKYNA